MRIYIYFKFVFVPVLAVGASVLATVINLYFRLLSLSVLSETMSLSIVDSIIKVPVY